MNAEAYSNHDSAATRSLARRLAARQQQGQSARRANNALLLSILAGAVITITAWAIRTVF